MSTSRQGSILRRPGGRGFSLFHVIFRPLCSHLRSWGHRCLADLRATTGQDLFYEVSQVVCQMVSIGYLPCLRGTFACSGCIILSSVMADNINFWMHLYPR